MPTQKTSNEKLDVHLHETLANRRSFNLNCSDWKAFLAALDAPSRRLPGLERLLQESGFFDAIPRS